MNITVKLTALLRRIIWYYCRCYCVIWKFCSTQILGRSVRLAAHQVRKSMQRRRRLRKPPLDTIPIVMFALTASSWKPKTRSREPATGHVMEQNLIEMLQDINRWRRFNGTSADNIRECNESCHRLHYIAP